MRELLLYNVVPRRNGFTTLAALREQYSLRSLVCYHPAGQMHVVRSPDSGSAICSNVAYTTIFAKSTHGPHHPHFNMSVVTTLKEALSQDGGWKVVWTQMGLVL